MKILLIFLLAITFTFAQNFSIEEQRFFDLEEQYVNQLKEIDSLKNVLNRFLGEVARVKNDEPENREKISSMMAQALEKSNIIDTREKSIIEIEKQLKQKRNLLYNSYTTKIDSLENLKQTDEIKSDLKDLNNKRLYVSPLLSQLSFDPNLVEKIKLSNSRDEKEKKIYKEYLDNALTEVDSNIVNLQQKSKNIREVIRLNEHAEDFMDDIEGDQFSGAFVVQEQALRGNERSFGDSWNNPLTEIASVAKIYNRISPFIYENINLQDYTLQDSVYTDDYLKLLEETEKTLRLYREKIKDKLE